MRTKDPKRIARNRSIVNVSSTSGLHGNVGQVNYATAKAGVVGLTKTIAKEWGPFGVRCNTVAFGCVCWSLRTATFPRRRERGKRRVPLWLEY